MERKPDVSKYTLDKAALIFIRHPGEIYTRLDIQNKLGVSKSTAIRVLTELSNVLNLTETRQGQTSYYFLSEVNAKKLIQTFDFVLAVADKERLALSFLLHSQGVSSVFSESIAELSSKLDKAGLLSYDYEAVQETHQKVQKIDSSKGNMLDTLFTALETKTKIDLEYKSAKSVGPKTHELYPAGLYLKDGNLYLFAYDPKHNDAMSYAYSRMLSISLRYDEHYTIPEGISMKNIINDPFGIANKEPRRIKVKIFGDQVFYEKERVWPKGTILTDNPDGSLTIEATTSDSFAFIHWVLSLGKSGKIEEPNDLIDCVIWEYEESLKKYKE